MKKRGRPTKENMTEEASQETQPRPTPSTRAKRPRRSAVGGAGSGGVLNVSGDKDPNFNYRVVNDEGSRVDVMRSFGYEVVTDDSVKFNSGYEIGTGSSHSVVVDKGTGKKAILMRQPMEFHEEDRIKRAKMIDDSEKSMFRKLETEEGRYGEVEQTNSLAKGTDD